MIIDFHKAFTKRAAQLKSAQRRRLEAALLLFMDNPYHPALYNHPLRGRWAGHRSISFGGDWRAHYILKGNDVALFVALGRHLELYGE